MGWIASKTWLVLGMVAVMPVLSVAQEEEPIYIESDSLHIDDNSGVSTYSGNVHFRQGAASLWADVVKVYAPTRKDVEKIVAEGKPARFRHKTEELEKNASGEASRIEFDAQESLVVLDGGALFKQGENQFAGNRIEYESDNKVVRAGGRVQIMIQPAESESSENEPSEKEKGSSSQP